MKMKHFLFLTKARKPHLTLEVERFVLWFGGFCFGHTNELTCRCVEITVCDWGGCARETKACLMVQQCEWACLCEYVDTERAVVGKATPEVLIPCVCVRYIGLFSWAQRACPRKSTHRHNIVLCWNWVLCSRKAKLRGDKWATVERENKKEKGKTLSRRLEGREEECIYETVVGHSKTWDKNQRIPRRNLNLALL